MIIYKNFQKKYQMNWIKMFLILIYNLYLLIILMNFIYLINIGNLKVKYYQIFKI